MGGSGRESGRREKSLRHTDSTLAARPPHPSPLPPKRGERERAAASGGADSFTSSADGGSGSDAAVNAGSGAGINTGISKRKLRADRLGKPAGTGPTSAAGKARSAQNARKHGLNVPVMYDPDVAFMAEEIAPGCQDPELIGRARRIAEAQVDLMRVARARRDIISAAMADPDYRPVTSLTGRTATPGADPGAGKLAAILSDISARLATLDWYERVALSRRKRAIRAFDATRRKAARRRPVE
jgi:hypothetical protein